MVKVLSAKDTSTNRAAVASSGARSIGPTPIRRVSRTSLLAAAVVIGIAVGWSALTALSAPSLTPAEIQPARAEAMVEHSEGQWQRQARFREIQERRAAEIVEWYEHHWKSGQLDR